MGPNDASLFDNLSDSQHNSSQIPSARHWKTRARCFKHEQKRLGQRNKGISVCVEGQLWSWSSDCLLFSARAPLNFRHEFFSQPFWRKTFQTRNRSTNFLQRSSRPRLPGCPLVCSRESIETGQGMIECKRANGQIQRATEVYSIESCGRSDSGWVVRFKIFAPRIDSNSG